MTSHNSDRELYPEVLQQIISSLTPLDEDSRIRLLDTVATYFQIESIAGRRTAKPSEAMTHVSGQVTPSLFRTSFSEREELSPKEFLLEKQPRTDSERVACLGYYLTHYCDTPHFKTFHISKLNTEAAQRKFANAAGAVNNATRSALLVQASKGQKQLSAVGEQFVQALPERETAKAVLLRMRPRRTKSPSSKTGKRSDKKTGVKKKQ